MIRCKLILFWSFVVITTVCFAQGNKNGKANNPPRIFRYTNPITRDSSISMRDHCIIKVGDAWYCTGTSNPVWIGHNPGVRILVSNDMIPWKQHSWLIDASKLPADCPYISRLGS